MIHVIPSTVIHQIISFVGLFANLNIIFATINNKLLQNNCNILIAERAIFEVVFQSGHWIFAVIIFGRTNFIPFDLCFKIMSHSLFGMCAGAFMPLVIGIDRLFSISFPTIYRVTGRIYLIIMIIIPFLYSGIIWYLSFNQMKAEPET